MIQIDPKLLKSIKEGNATQKDLINHLSTYPLNEILTAFAELIILSEDFLSPKPISVSQEEYNRILSLFKIKGMMSLDGVMVEETRGRKPNKMYKG
jgi:hypothetical protein